ncbi:hypothetical protein CFOL_v3_23447 [Cephalotus follicularis]|uniref:Uncharacterized protein n=1 Tax=Cephalotus follicularis TaxID=3775 RepID=A0A1Q3CID5_CEPFO|nr:hypothetical protein CFOL_v3_23447 [Cephalotus follicularis]
MIVNRDIPTLATNTMPLERGGGATSAGLVVSDLLAKAGSGGSTTSATSRAGEGAAAGGITSAGTKLSSWPGSAGKMKYGRFASRLEHGLPAAPNISWVLCHYSINFHSCDVGTFANLDNTDESSDWIKTC